MLEVALKSGIPIIGVDTHDALSLPDIVAALCGKPVETSDDGPTAQTLTKGAVHVVRGGALKKASYEKAYSVAEDGEAHIVLVNPEPDLPGVFYAGLAPVPRKMLVRLLNSIEIAKPQQDSIIPRLAGLTLIESRNVLAIASTVAGSITPQSVETARRMVLPPTRGLQLVDTAMPFYDPEGQLKYWLETEGKLFLNDNTPSVLVPRGLLFGGRPGTGKSMGAKYVARTLGLPLYRIDLGTMLGKYHGDSEGNLTGALASLDQAAPCVAFVDEIEKVFNAKTSDEDGGVVKRLLASLLWWMQEHKSRVLLCAAANDIESLPRELYRPGRIDCVMTFQGLDTQRGKHFCTRVVQSLGAIATPASGKILETFSAKFPGNHVYTQADYTGYVHDSVKAHIIGTMNAKG